MNDSENSALPFVRYQRQPSPEFLQIFKPDGLLNGATKPASLTKDGLKLPVDFHFRENDQASIYFGLTQLVKFCFKKGSAEIAVSAHQKYMSQDVSEFFRNWKLTEKGFSEALSRYLEIVKVAPRNFRHEGQVQAAWSMVREPWVPFDREAVIGYASSSQRKLQRKFCAVKRAQDAISDIDSSRTKPPKVCAPAELDQIDVFTPAELDQLAVDPEGRLVLIELKNAQSKKCNPAQIYNSPLQLLQYVHEWASAYSQVESDLNALIAARKAIGLSAHAPALKERQIRPVVGFLEDGRTDKVKDRFERVLNIVNEHLPERCSPMEAWCISGQTPQRLL